ncbi:MAG TPA: alpha/beta hydrolase-fold protein [Yinghuangia sp.]|nr:alpha/beta hydrolase-fold protein [Yinghuangia sp.]
MRPVTRKALKGLLIAVTLGFAVALFVRARRAASQGAQQPAPAGDFTDEAGKTLPPSPPGRPPAPVPLTAAPTESAPSAPEPAADRPLLGKPVAHGSAGERPAEERTAAGKPVAGQPVAAPPSTTSPSATRTNTSGTAPIAVASDVVEIAPDRAAPVPRPARRRRSQLVVGAVMLAFVVVACAVGVLAYDSIDGDDNDGTAPAAAMSSDSTQRPSAGPTDTFGPLAPQKFEAQGTRSGGTLNHLLLDGRRSGVTADVWVWLPPQYQSDALRTKRFPVLVVHSAYPGIGENSLLETDSGLLAKLVAGVADGTLPPFIVVAPELTPYQQSELDAASTPEALDTECSDIPGRPRMATFHNEDVREAVAATFRVATDRSSWALLGEEAGGLCAAKYALQYPQYYATAASLSGGTTLRSPLWPTGAGVRQPQEPLTLVAQRPDVNLLLVDTASDTAGRQASTALKDAAQSPTVVETATNTSSDASRQLPSALAFFERNVTDSTLVDDDAPASGSPSGAPTTAGAGATATATRRATSS